uniref:Protein kinase domain-containing protein n=1 Tax=Gouania willdenowi TaxID=441366 RepID=A0A8C5GR67_GOUWI
KESLDFLKELQIIYRKYVWNTSVKILNTNLVPCLSTLTAHPLMVGHALHSPSTRYTILEVIGEGSFGKVVECRAHNSSKLVAVKILKKYFQNVEDEVSVWCLQQNFNYEFLG